MIYTFYSYKGGVGRTMALANVAEALRRGDAEHPQGRNVLMIDWDLEAPGLEQFFLQGEQLDDCRARPGLMELLEDYKRQMTRKQDLSDEDRWPFLNPTEYAQPIEHDDGKGRLWLLTPGRRSPEQMTNYINAVMNFDWQDFYENWAGEVYFDWFRRQCKQLAEVILIDSRTGITEMSGVCTYHLADVVALFCAPNHQNIRGIETMLNNLQQPHLRDLRGGRPLKTLVVPSRVDITGTEEQARLRRQLAPLNARSETDEDLLIPYIRSYAFDEMIAVTQRPDSDHYSRQLSEAYERLAGRMLRLGGDVRGIWETKQAELKEQLKKLRREASALLNQRIQETVAEKKAQMTAEMEQIDQQRRAVEEELTRAQREFQYYLR